MYLEIHSSDESITAFPLCTTRGHPHSEFWQNKYI